MWVRSTNLFICLICLMTCFIKKTAKFQIPHIYKNIISLTYFAEPMLGRLLLAGDGTGGGENLGGAGTWRPWILIVSSWRRSPGYSFI